MEIISYISTSDGYTHYLLVPTMGIPLVFWLLLIGGCISLIFLVLKKIIG